MAVAAMALSGAASAETAEFVAGTAPHQRPDGAPRITTYEKSPAWYVQATAGVSQPFPPSLKFLDDQGGWFTPFTRPGMTGPYDIRGLHARRLTHGEAEPPSQ